MMRTNQEDIQAVFDYLLEKLARKLRHSAEFTIANIDHTPENCAKDNRRAGWENHETEGSEMSERSVGRGRIVEGSEQPARPAEIFNPPLDALLYARIIQIMKSGMGPQRKKR